MNKTPSSGRCLALAGLVLSLAASAAEEPRTRKDAAEAVQEGNVQNWIEYYERTRPPRPAERTAEPASPADTGKSKDPAGDPPRR